MRFNELEREVVKKLYGEITLCVDSLPYTDDFEHMYEEFTASVFRKWSKNEFFVAMTSLRKKKGGLKKVISIN